MREAGHYVSCAPDSVNCKLAEQRVSVTPQSLGCVAFLTEGACATYDEGLDVDPSPTGGNEVLSQEPPVFSHD